MKRSHLVTILIIIVMLLLLLIVMAVYNNKIKQIDNKINSSALIIKD